MLNALGDIAAALAMQKGGGAAAAASALLAGGGGAAQLHALDQQYQSLDADIELVSPAVKSFVHHPVYLRSDCL